MHNPCDFRWRGWYLSVSRMDEAIGTVLRAIPNEILPRLPGLGHL
jgi:hypothetical protein